MNRTQKDLDITRMSCLKSATEIVGAVITSGKEVPDDVKWADWTIKVADLFTTWVLDGKTKIDRTVDQIKEEVAQGDEHQRTYTSDEIVDEIAKQARPSTHEIYDDAIAASKERQKPKKKKPGNGGGITDKQFAYLMKMVDKNRSGYSEEVIGKLSASDASDMIDDYLGKEPRNGGNGGNGGNDFEEMRKVNGKPESHYRPTGDLGLSNKQFHYILYLHKKLNLTANEDEIRGYNRTTASSVISELKEEIKPGNGNRI